MDKHLKPLFHRTRCDRDTLIPMLEKLTEKEKTALWRLLEEVKRTNKQKKVGFHVR